MNCEYIQNQLKEDEPHSQLTMREYTDPLTASNTPLAGPQIAPFRRFLQSRRIPGGYFSKVGKQRRAVWSTKNRPQCVWE